MNVKSECLNQPDTIHYELSGWFCIDTLLLCAYEQAMRVVKNGNANDVGNGKVYYYLARDEKEGVLVVVKNGQIESMMTSNYKYFRNRKN